MRKADYSFKINEFCGHGPLFLWQLQHFMDTGCLNNKVAKVTFTRFLLNITANLIDKICHYASHMNEPSLNASFNTHTHTHTHTHTQKNKKKKQTKKTKQKNNNNNNKKKQKQQQHNNNNKKKIAIGNSVYEGSCSAIPSNIHTP